MNHHQGVRIPNIYLASTLSVLLTAAIGLSTWSVASVYARPTEEKVERMIQMRVQTLVGVIRDLKHAVELNTKITTELSVLLNNPNLHRRT